MGTGEIQDAGWQVDVSRTLDAAPAVVWELLVSEQGLRIWLGEGADLDLDAGRWTARDADGEVRSFHAREQVRLQLPTDDRSHRTTAQLAIRASDDGRTELTCHEERLRDPGERMRRRDHWRSVADRLEAVLRDR